MLRLDFLLPLSAYPTMPLMFVEVAPWFAIWQWGMQGTGTVQALIVEEFYDLDYGSTLNYRVDYMVDSEGGPAAKCWGTTTTGLYGRVPGQWQCFRGNDLLGATARRPLATQRGVNQLAIGLELV